MIYYDDQDFWNAYERLSQEGQCDSPGGGEYRRVLEEWHQFGHGVPLDTFIVTRASMMSDGTTRAILN